MTPTKHDDLEKWSVLQQKRLLARHTFPNPSLSDRGTFINAPKTKPWGSYIGRADSAEHAYLQRTLIQTAKKRPQIQPISILISKTNFDPKKKGRYIINFTNSG